MNPSVAAVLACVLVASACVADADGLSGDDPQVTAEAAGTRERELSFITLSTDLARQLAPHLAYLAKREQVPGAEPKVYLVDSWSQLHRRLAADPAYGEVKLSPRQLDELFNGTRQPELRVPDLPRDLVRALTDLMTKSLARARAAGLNQKLSQRLGVHDEAIYSAIMHRLAIGSCAAELRPVPAASLTMLMDFSSASPNPISPIVSGRPYPFYWTGTLAADHAILAGQPIPWAELLHMAGALAVFGAKAELPNAQAQLQFARGMARAAGRFFAIN